MIRTKVATGFDLSTDEAPKPNIRGGESLAAIEKGLDPIGAAIFPWPLAIPAAFFAVIAAGALIGEAAVSTCLVAVAVGCVPGAGLQVLGAWLFHRPLDRRRRRPIDAPACTGAARPHTGGTSEEISGWTCN